MTGTRQAAVGHIGRKDAEQAPSEGPDEAGTGAQVRVLMLGWEFPPFISGGLGTACQGLTRAMARLGTRILFVLPKAVGTSDTVREIPSKQEGFGTAMTFRAVPSEIVSPYQYTGHAPARSSEAAPDPASVQAPPAVQVVQGGGRLRVTGTGSGDGYAGDLLGRIGHFTERCLRMTQHEAFDVIHAHDWVTYPAGMALAARSGKPLVVHVHSTEFDRSGEVVNQPVYDIERAGMHAARAVIAVSHLTARIVVERYGVPPEKVHVVHNGIDPRPVAAARPRDAAGPKTVLFLGRITMQKGPGYFVEAAEKVLTRLGDVRFVIAGWGDLGPSLVQQVAARGLSRRIRFAGFLRGAEVERAYAMSHVYVMPSISEPFGLTALEAIQHRVPVVLSKNSGVAEVLHRGALKVDFWDVDQMADKIIALLRHPELGEAVARDGADEIRSLTWDQAARKCVGVYRDEVHALSS